MVEFENKLEMWIFTNTGFTWSLRYSILLCQKCDCLLQIYSCYFLYFMGHEDIELTIALWVKKHI